MGCDYSTPYGDWNGQTQYKVSIKDQPSPAIHTVTNLSIRVDIAGKIMGYSAENGCKILGIAKATPNPTLLELNVATSGCQQPSLNRTFSGSLHVYPSSQYASFSLNDVTFGVGRVSETYSITATMRH